MPTLYPVQRVTYPRSRVFDESFLGQTKRLLIGRPIPSSLAHHERFSKATGLAVLSSDALSSVAYATEEILRVLMIGGLAALTLSLPISLMIAALLAIVAFSYRQTIKVYSRGGGDYMRSVGSLVLNLPPLQHPDHLTIPQQPDGRR